MLSWPYLMTKEWLPYRDIAIAHTSLLLVILAFIYKIIGVGVSQLQLLTWVLILSTDIFLWAISSKLWSKKNATLSLAIYVLLQIIYEGNGLWFDLALAPLLLFMYYFLQQKKYLLSGLLFGAALFTKQTSAWIAFPVAIDVLRRKPMNFSELEKRIAPLATGAVVFIFVTTLVMYFTGILPYFAHWGIEFGIFTLPKLSGQIDLPSMRELLKALLPFAPMLLIIKKLDQKISVLIIWGAFATLGIYPRWELFHFQPALPFFSIACALLLEKYKVLRNYYFLVLSILLLLFVKSSFGLPVRFSDQTVSQVVEAVNNETNPTDEIYVLNYWDNIYALTDNLPATKPLIPYIPWYLDYQQHGLFIKTELQKEFPKVIIKGQYSPGLGGYKIEGLDEFIEKYYYLDQKIGNVEIYIKNQ